jgi:formylglycine-generating enzyme required for sulfatase activity
VQPSTQDVYCIDQREVTFEEYKVFLAAKSGDVQGQATECSWNTTFDPEYLAPGDDTSIDKCPVGSQPKSDDEPANCIDFCDALAYCEWAGKRLCGRIGGSKKWGRVDIGFKDGNEPVGPQWEALQKVAESVEMEFGYACTQGGTTAYPYGASYEPGRCIDAQWVAEKGTNSLEVDDLSNRSCHGSTPPFDQIYDLSGSVSEWQNLCGSTTSPSCLTIGGSWSELDKTQMACAADVGFAGMRPKDPFRGFRCCADAVAVESSL